MKITNHEALAILESLNKLDSCKFDGDGGVLRYRIAKNIRLLSPIKEDFEVAIQRVFRDLANGRNSLPAGSEEAFKLTDAERHLRKEPVEVVLMTLSFTKLKVDENNVGASTIAALAPILTDLPELKD